MEENRWTAAKIGKPIIVRVKRKTSQSRWDALRLEIKENLSQGNSISESCANREMVLVQHLQTVSCSADAFVVLRPFGPNSSNALKVDQKNAQGKANIENVLPPNASFKQVFKTMVIEKELLACRIYDFEFEECGSEVEEKNGMHPDEDAAPTVEIIPELCKQAPSDSYEYDFYTVNEFVRIEAELANQFPLVEVDDYDDNIPDYKMEDFIGKDDELEEVFSAESGEELKDEIENSEDEQMEDSNGILKVSRAESGEKSKEEIGTSERFSITSKDESVLALTNGYGYNPDAKEEWSMLFHRENFSDSDEDEPKLSLYL